MYDIMEEEVLEFQAAELPDEPRFCSQAEFNDKPDSLFFNDGVRKIDFILVYEDEDKKEFEKRHAFQRRKVAFLKLLITGSASKVTSLSPRRLQLLSPSFTSSSACSVCEGSFYLQRDHG